MGYQTVETFDHYNTAFLGSMFDSVNGSPLVSSSYARFPAIGGFPNQGVFVPSGSALRRNLKSNAATLIAFMTFGVPSLPGSPQVILPFWDAGTMQCFLGLTATGALQFFTQVPTFAPIAIGPSSSFGLITASSKAVHGIEVQVTFSASGGSVECYLNGALVITLTGGLNTIKSANSFANQIGINAPPGAGYNNGLSIYCDYLRVWDTTGSYQNALVGFDVRKLTKLAAGAGDLTQWTPNGATFNWQCTNEASPDGDTTYVSSTSTNYDSYAMGTSGFSGVPSMTVVKSIARKDDGATRTLQIGVRSSSTNGLGSAFTMSSAFAVLDTCISVDPATGSPPTAAAADAFQHLKFEAS
jgi:hypothetical protein